MHRNREINHSVDGSKNFGALVQLVRKRACHARGQGFESPTHRQKGRSKGLPFLFFCCVYFLRRGADVNVVCCSCGVCALCKHSAHSPSPTIAKRCPPRLVSSNLLFGVVEAISNFAGVTSGASSAPPQGVTCGSPSVMASPFESSVEYESMWKMISLFVFYMAHSDLLCR